MLSLDNAYSAEELAAWEAHCRELAGPLPVEYVTELKMDGLSVALRYEATEAGGARFTTASRAATARPARMSPLIFAPFVASR